MKIKKNGKVINLSESDLRRISKRVISEQLPNPVPIYPKRPNPLNDLDGLEPCKETTLKGIVGSLKDMGSNDKLKVEVSSKNGKVLIISNNYSKCGCTKDEFFANV